MPNGTKLKPRYFDEPWELIVAAYEKRWPTCKLIPVLKEAETISDVHAEDGSTRVVQRRCKIEPGAPLWMRKLVGAEFVYFIQTNTYDFRNRVLKIESRNESFSKKMEIHETCYYHVNPNDSDKTVFEQEATFEISSFLGMEKAVEKLALRVFVQNAKNGKNILLTHLDELKEEGITYVPPWTENGEYDGARSEDDLASFYECTSVFGDDDAVSIDTVYTDVFGDLHEFDLGDDELYNWSDMDEKLLDSLEEEEKAKVVQLRKLLCSYGVDAPHCEQVVRFLRAREGNLNEGYDMIVKAIEWRRTYGTDSLMAGWEPSSLLNRYFPGVWHGRDVDGRPLFVLRIGSMDLKGLMKVFGKAYLVNFTINLIERGLQICREVNLHDPCKLNNWTILVDLEGLGLKHMWRPGIKLCSTIAQIVQSYYPETVHRLVLVRPSPLFSVIWHLVKGFLDEGTRGKVTVIPECNEEVFEYIPKEFVPECLGGLDPISISGGTVPRNLYGNDWVESEGDYAKKAIGRRSTCRLVVHVKLPDTVITWDYSMAGSDNGFGVYYSSQSGTQRSIHMKLVNSSDAVVDGENAQGTYKCEKEGFYVLRWFNKSWIKSKELSYYVNVIVPCSDDDANSITSITSVCSGMSKISGGSRSSYSSGSGISR
eukprot:Nk52_evm1s252 gene=Nk52_evmTU1s252